MFETLGKFQIRRRLGQGAMGEVYLGTDPTIGRDVAIKTILATAAQGEESKARFQREAKAAGVLNHPNLVTIYEFGEDQGVLYIAMEYVKGEDLEDTIREQSLKQSEVLEVLAQVCDGLAFAHHAGIVHRDIKPSNVRVIRDGRRLHAKVMDFGVARISDSDMTGTGMVMGTVSYMAPEYIRTGKPDPRSDLFAVGVMLYETLSGRKPFSGDTTPTILYKIVNEAPEPLDPSQLHGISPAIKTVLDRALDKDPDQRYQTGEELAKALRAAKDPTWQGQAEIGTVRLNSAPTAPVVSPAAQTAAMPMPSNPAMPLSVSQKKSRGPLVALVALFLLCLLGAGGFLYLQSRGALPWMTTSATGQTPEDPAASTLAPVQGITNNGETGSPHAGQSAHQVPAVSAGNPVESAPGSITSPALEPALPKHVTPLPPPEKLEQMEVHERMNQANVNVSEGIQLVDKQPDEAFLIFRNAIRAQPGHPLAYAWWVMKLIELGRYDDAKRVIREAENSGVSLDALAQRNLRLKVAIAKARMNGKL